MTKSAKPDAWMPLFIGDYKKDTGRLTRDQHGGYMLLIMEYWNTGPLLDDDEELAAIVLADAREWRRLRPKLERFFKIEAGVWRHSRIDKELERWGGRKAKFIERAQAAAAARWAKNGPSDDPPKKRRRHASSNAPSTQQAVLAPCPLPLPTEVDAPSGQSTLCGRERPEAHPEGASSLRVIEGGPDTTERGWLFAAAGADAAMLRCLRSDPDRASELAEFIAYAKAEAAKLRRSAA